MSTILVPTEAIETRIFLIRGKKVMINTDLAKLYKVQTKVLNQSVKRNIKRFPEDFMFQLTKEEKEEVVTNCDHLSKLRFSPVLPYVFTEQGVAMLSSVLNSERAIMVNIQIMRTFTKLREFAEAFGGEKALIDNVLSLFFRGERLKPGKLSFGFIEDREKESYVDAKDFFRHDTSFREHLSREISELLL